MEILSITEPCKLGYLTLVKIYSSEVLKPVALYKITNYIFHLD